MEDNLPSPVTKPPYYQKMKDKRQQKDATKTSITQQLRTNLGLSVGVTTVIQLVWLNQITGFQPSHYPQKLYNQKDTHLKIYK